MNHTRTNFRQYGDAPARTVLLHGGPGGAGEIEPLARELGRRGYAVLEPFQTMHSVGEQVDELRSQIEEHCTSPVDLIGWSWGAWLGCLLAAKHGNLVRKLILVGSGPFESQYSSAIRTTKNSRLTNQERAELKAISLTGKDAVARFIELSDVADTYERDGSPIPTVSLDRTIHAAVWPEADGMRKSGALLDAVATIQCPVLAIHGDYDPRPSAGVEIPLKAVLPNAQFVLLEQCGHKPWQEIHVKDAFYSLVENALS